MMKKSASNLTPSKLRIILSVTILLITLAGGGGFYYVYGMLNESAEETRVQVSKATESENTLQRLQNLEHDLKEKSDSVARASRVTADSQNYSYQNQLVNDLTTYASRANLTITNISFSAGGATTTEDGEAAVQKSGLRSAKVNVTLSSPVDYRNLLNFLHYVEQNLTKLKIGRVTLTKGGEEGVSVGALDLEVHIR